MKFKFAHIADNHIGYRQYNMNERRRDFAIATLKAMDICISEQVDFVLLAGDFFHIKDPHWKDLQTAKNFFDGLNKEYIHSYAILGNHDYPRIYDESDWTQLFSNEYIHNFHNIVAHKGNGYNIVGYNWLGNNTENEISKLSEFKISPPSLRNGFNILMLHGGVDDVLNNSPHNVKQETLLKLKNNPFHYVALGHIHKPYEIDNFIFNPGSLEACSTSEQEYNDRGIYIVTVNDDNTFVAEKHIIENRKYYAINASMLGKEKTEYKQKAIWKVTLDAGSEEEARGWINQYEPLHIIIKKPNDFNLNDVNLNKIYTDKNAIYKSVFGEQLNRALKVETAISKQTDIEQEVFK